MNKKDVKIGMKVVPFQKTTYSGLENSGILRDAKRIGQPYLYVCGWDDDENCFYLHVDKNEDSGDFFNPEDFEPYVN